MADKRRQRWIRVVYLLLAVVVVAQALLSVDSADGEESERKLLALVTFTPTHSWTADVKRAMEEEITAVCEENGWECVMRVGRDATEQSRCMLALAERQVDCMILFPLDGASLKTAALLVQKKGIPLVVFDREIPDFAPAATVKGDNGGIGRLAASVLNDRFPQGTKVLELMGDTSTVPSQRTDGFDEQLAESMEKEQLGYTNWQREEARDLFLAWARSHTQQEIDRVEAVYVHDDEIAFGVLDALELCRMEGPKFENLQVMVGGTSGAREMYERILEETELEMTFALYSPAMGREAVRVGERILKGEEYQEMTILPTKTVNRKNAGSYLEQLEKGGEGPCTS